MLSSLIVVALAKMVGGSHATDEILDDFIAKDDNCILKNDSKHFRNKKNH